MAVGLEVEAAGGLTKALAFSAHKEWVSPVSHCRGDLKKATLEHSAASREALQCFLLLREILGVYFIQMLLVQGKSSIEIPFCFVPQRRDFDCLTSTKVVLKVGSPSQQCHHVWDPASFP